MMETIALPAVPMETEATSASTQTMMWRECRGLTIRHRSQSPTLTTITDESTATAIRKSLINSQLAAQAIAEAISIAHATTISQRPNR
jgi:hypothetical protein